jgi:hypothetical protein
MWVKQWHKPPIWETIPPMYGDDWGWFNIVLPTLYRMLYIYTYRMLYIYILYNTNHSLWIIAVLPHND